MLKSIRDYKRRKKAREGLKKWAAKFVHKIGDADTEELNNEYREYMLDETYRFSATSPLKIATNDN